MNTPWKPDPIHPKAREGIELFNRGEFYEAHEPLEAAWMETDSPERDLYQAILQIGLAYYQITRGNYRGALKMFKRGQRNLAPLGNTFLGLDLTQFEEDARLVETKLRQQGPKNISRLNRKFFKSVPETR